MKSTTRKGNKCLMARPSSGSDGAAGGAGKPGEGADAVPGDAAGNAQNTRAGAHGA